MNITYQETEEKASGSRWEDRQWRSVIQRWTECLDSDLFFFCISNDLHDIWPL